METIFVHSDVQIDDVSRFERPAIGNPMANDFINRRA